MADDERWRALVRDHGEAEAIIGLRGEALAFVATELAASLDADRHTTEDLSRMRELVAMHVELSRARSPLLAAPTGSRSRS